MLTKITETPEAEEIPAVLAAKQHTEEAPWLLQAALEG
jgi:hypothetical protein